jgi:hypothetical protein
MRHHLSFLGALLTAGGTAVLVAAFLPSLYPVWLARGVNALTLISPHRGSWQLANWLFGIGAGLTLAGLAALTALLNRQPQPGAGLLPTASLALMTVATTLWIASLGFRLTVTVRTVDAVSTGGQVPDWYEPVNSWSGALWSAAALTGAAATIGYGFAMIDGGVLPGWTGWLALGVGAVMLGLFVFTRDVPPFLLYLAPTAFGVMALIRVATADRLAG